jgi:hypothetical protein
MPSFGSFALLLAFVLSTYCLVIGTLSLWAIARKRQLAIPADLLRETARRAGLASFVAVFGAAFALIWAFTTDDFSVDYVLHHSSKALYWGYKISTLWSGQEGSSAALELPAQRLRLRAAPAHKNDVTLYAYASTILAASRSSSLRCSSSRCLRSRWFPEASLRQMASVSTRCSNIPRWRSIRRCSTSATSVSPSPSPSLLAL